MEGMNNRSVLFFFFFFFIAAFHHSQRCWNYLAEMNTGCACVQAYFIYPAAVCVCAPHVGVGVCGHAFFFLSFTCTHGALIPASLSNYLNCAYRSYCTAHFSLGELYPVFLLACCISSRNKHIRQFCAP